LYLYDPNSGSYGEIQDALGTTYITNMADNGQVNISQGGSNTTFDGAFNFTADETSPNQGAASISVTNGTFTNM
jgi:hypothetical protein